MEVKVKKVKGKGKKKPKKLNRKNWLKDNESKLKNEFLKKYYKKQPKE